MQASLSRDRVVGVAIRSSRRLYRDALAACIGGRPDFTVVGHAGNDDDLLQLCALRSPELVLFDACGGITDALAALRRLRSGFDQVRVVVMYEQISSEELTEVWKLGVDTLVPCSHGLDALLVVLQQRARAVRTEPVQTRRRESGLTDTEREIIALIGAGHTVSRIAELLGTTTFAVENSKRRIYHKLQVVSQSHAIARASALGLVERPPTPKPFTGKPDGVALVALRGPECATRDLVVVSLLSGRVPFVIDQSGQSSQVDTWGRWHTGPVMLVLVDPEPPDWEGVDKLEIPVLLVTSKPLPRGETLKVLGYGVIGILSADVVEQLLAPSLLLAASGCLTVGPGSVGELITGLRAKAGGRDDGLPELTVRESEILRSIAAGDTVRQTARSLGIAEKTVENTQARLFRKLGARNRAGAAAIAYALGLLDEQG